MSRPLEDRVVAALKERGLLSEATATKRPTGHRLFAALAASLALFLGGMASGLWMGTRSTADALARYEALSVIERAAAVQREGSEYVAALAALETPPYQLDDPALRTALEVGHVALHAAALELARMDPYSPVLREIVAVLESDRSVPDDAATQRVVWY